METSDSEYFESADENFSEDESTELKKTVNQIKTELENLKLNSDDESEGVNVKQQQQLLKLSDESIRQDVERTKTSNKPLLDKTYENISKADESKLLETSCSSKVTVHNFLKDVHFEDTIEKRDSDKVQKDQEERQTEKHLGDQKDKPTEAKLTVQKDKTTEKGVSEVEDDLWAEDGWEIEEEIDIPQTGEKEVTTTIDPLDCSEENMWNKEEWEELSAGPSDSEIETCIQQNLTKDQQNQSQPINNQDSNDSWGGWSTWGVSSFLSSATQSVSTITNHVSQGFSSVLESGIGIPPAEELAKLNSEKENKTEHGETGEETDVDKSAVSDTDELGGYVFGNFGHLVSGVSNITKFVEATGTKVISGGLETLETIGKKTMEVLQEGDPGLKKKRAFLKLEQEKPILSQVLREAKERAEMESKEIASQTQENVKKVNYEALFDDYHGLVHLEALEMLSKQCEMKLQTVCDNCSGEALNDINETMDQVKELCELPDEDEDEHLTTNEIKERLQCAVKDINVNISYEKLISSWEETEKWLDNIKLNICNEDEIHQQAIESLAQLTALAVEQYHKAGELLLIKECHNTADEADSLVQLTTTLTSLIGIVAAKFSDKLNLMMSSKTEENKDNINSLITNVFYEASNSSSYLQDAFQLLIPVLQVGAI